MKIAIRGFKGKFKIFEERLDMSDPDIDNLLPKLAEQHAKLLADAPHMIEIEFLEEPNQLERFFRFGTDPSGMMEPIAMHLAVSYEQEK